MPVSYVFTALWNIDTEVNRRVNVQNAIGALNPLQRAALLERVLEQAWWALAEDVWALGETMERERAEFRILFVAPEYYFASSDTAHAILQLEKDIVIGRLTALSRRFGEGLILVPGSIAWKKPVFRTGAYVYKKDPATGQRTQQIKTSNRLQKFEKRVTDGAAMRGHLSRDVAIREAARYHLDEVDTITWHGDRARQERDTALTAMSNNYRLDPRRCSIARNTLYGFVNGAEVMRHHKWINFNEVTVAESDGGYVIFEPGGGAEGRERFTVDGIIYDGEICAEHVAGYLAQTRRTPPDVQIIVSAVTPFQPHYMIVPRSGYVVHASSDRDCTAVFRNDGRGAVQVPTRDEAAERGLLRYATLRFEK